ncbi:MAG: hypothetical protein HC915_02280 [Anaerolineae bacterium]|nr:hypothetical protein [Anaerolineae bacterium]
MRFWNRLESFDLAALNLMVGLLLAMGLVVLAGNNVGVRIESYTPSGSARADASIRVRFFDDMRQNTTQLEITPALAGNLRWNGPRELVFEPSEEFQPRQRYEVRLAAGARSTSGATLKDPFTFSFSVALPRIVYLAPVTAPDRNLYTYDLNSGAVEQITFSENGLADFNISQDGRTVAYTRYDSQGGTDIWLYDLQTNSTRQLTNCGASQCMMPTWSPDNRTMSTNARNMTSFLANWGPPAPGWWIRKRPALRCCLRIRKSWGTLRSTRRMASELPCSISTCLASASTTSTARTTS